MPSIERPFVRHHIVEIFGLDRNFLLHTHLLQKPVQEFIDFLDLKVLDKIKYDFKPFGATFLFVLSSSHLVVHTWPENNYLHIDLFSCGNSIKYKNIGKAVKKILKADVFKIQEIPYPCSEQL